jgi:iron complex transport system substrate-binding protein
MKKIFFSILLIFLISTDVFSLRIISLSPNITEIIFALGAGNEIVGNTTFCNYPEKAKYITKIGSYMKPSIEKIFELKPDIVLGMKSGQEKSIKTKLDELNIKSKFYVANNVDDIKQLIKSIGKTLHKDPSKLLNRINEYFNKYPQTIFNGIFLINISPLMAAGNNTFVNDIMKCSGIKNIVTFKESFPLINKEFIIKNNPDIIIMSFMGNDNSLKIKNLISRFMLKSKLLIVNSDIYNRPSHRIVDACLDLRKKIKIIKD